MRIWLATVGEPLRLDENNPRLLRSGQFAEWLQRRGHEVIFWTGTVDHYAKRLRAAVTTVHRPELNYTIVLLAGRLYLRTVSYARFMNHVDVARSFRKNSADFSPPDIVLASYPTEELCRAILDYAEPRGIPVVIDTRDFWPDIFSELLPGPTKKAYPLVFGWLERRARRTLARAYALSGMTRSAMQWALVKSGRPQRDTDFWFPFSYRKEVGNGDAAGFSDKIVSLFPKEPVLKFCFFGTLSHRSNLSMVVDAFRLLQARGVRASVAICGTGAELEALKSRASGLENVHFPGWLNAGEIASLMKLCDYGVLPYDREDFHLSLPNKFIEYLAGGLPILSCTEGEVREFIEGRGCGVWAPPTVESFATAVAEMVQSPGQTVVASQNATKAFNEVFEEDAVFTHVLERLRVIATLAKAGGIEKQSSPFDREGGAF